jgi:hypothetical protein
MTRVFTLMDSTAMEAQTEDRRAYCMLMSSSKVEKLMRKTCQSKGHNAELHVINIT